MFEDMEKLELVHEGTLLRGYVAKPEGPGPFPAVLVMHSAQGVLYPVNAQAAKKLADVGYVAVCTDMFGAHLEGASQEEIGAAFADLMMNNPEKQRSRTVAWFQKVSNASDVDAGRLGAIGFCYGGTTVLELARSGANLNAAISYHGGLSTYARAEPHSLKCHVAAYCGARDPWVSHGDIDDLRNEMVSAGHEKYQITIFGDADHGFTDPDAASLNMDGVAFDELSNSISWLGTLGLLEYVFMQQAPGS